MLYIFDLDGTLVDSLLDLATATEHALKALNLPGHELDEYKYFIGNGVRKLILRALGKENEKLYPEARKLFDEYYQIHCLDHTVAYEGIYELIEDLHKQGHIIAVNTNKPDALAKLICRKRFSNYIDYVVGQQEKLPTKPNPSAVINIMNHYHATKKQTIFIGDSDVDILTGRNAGIKSVGVTWGNREKEELVQAGASFVVKNVHELRLILEKTKK